MTQDGMETGAILINGIGGRPARSRTRKASPWGSKLYGLCVQTETIPHCAYGGGHGPECRRL